jgi:SAM-dependent methyltransferase
MDETKKAMARRSRELTFDWARVFQGRGVDIGCGPDKLPFPECEGFDQEQGDANEISKYFPPETFDYIHASQCLEHMHNPLDALRDWLKILKPKGYAVISVPDFVLYEQLNWPSKFNPDHKSTWSLTLPDSPSGQHILVPKWLDFCFHAYQVRKLALIDTNYDYRLIGTMDQTFHFNVEAFIEFVLQKP